MTNLIKEGWFSESEVLWPGQRMSLAVDKVLETKKTEFQDLMVFQSKTYGKVLVLDGVIQLTERDEFAYQEMLVHVPLFSHPNPKSVCIIGGGDGGILREVARHPGVEEIVMCEIDRAVCDASKKYFADSMATAFGDKRLDLKYADGAKFLSEKKKSFDIIIVDSSDPVGPAETLFEAGFYKTMREALKSGGIVCTQGECQWLHLDIIKSLLQQSQKMYGSVRYGYLTIPTYPSGQIGFVICCESKWTDPETPARQIPESIQKQLRYYNPEVHKAAFVLPQFAAEHLESNIVGDKHTKAYHLIRRNLNMVTCNMTIAALALGVAIGCAFARK